MANKIATITRFLDKMVDQVFVESSKTEILENGSKFIDLNFKEAGYVKIYSLLMDGLSDYYRANSVTNDPEGPLAGQWDGTTSRDTTAYARYAPEYDDSNYNRDGFARGSVQGRWELLKLRYFRAKQFVVDEMDDEETAGAIIGNLLTEFIRTKVVPEVDVVRFAKLASVTNAAFGNLVTETLAYDSTTAGVTSIIAKFNEAFLWLNKHEVPSEDQVIFVSEDVWGLLQLDPNITRYLDVQNRKSDLGVEYRIQTYNGRPIIHVPESRFFTNPTLGSNGYYPNSASKKINFIVCSAKCIIPVVKLEYTKIWTPDTQDDFMGYKVNFALYHDAIIPENKKIGVYASVDSGAADSGVIDFAVVDSTTKAAPTASTTKINVNDFITKPAGLLGTLIFAGVENDPFTVGASTNVSTYASNVVELGTTEITLSASTGDTGKCHLALVQHGVVIAKGSYQMPQS